MTQAEMRQHLRTAGLLHIAWGVLHFAGGVLLLLLFAGIGAVYAGVTSSHFYHAVPWLGLIVAGIIGLMILLSLPEILAGIGLLQLRPWSRPLALVVSAFDVFHFPLGTALGVYTIWALTTPAAAQLLDGTQSSTLSVT